MAKARITFTCTKEYELNPSYYLDGATPEEMLAVDIENGNDDPFLSIGDDADFVVTGEIIA